VALAAIALFAGFLLGRPPEGTGLAAGLLIGSLNGELLRRAVVSHAPFVASSVIRLALISSAAILVAIAVGASTVALLLGVAAAQLVMVTLAVRQGLRA
jgi:hypothetical protein